MIDTVDIKWDKDFQFEDFKLGNIYIIDNTIDYKSGGVRFRVITKCITKKNGHVAFNDIGVLIGGAEEMLQDWDLTEEDFGSRRYKVMEIDPDEYPEYYI